MSLELLVIILVFVITVMMGIPIAFVLGIVPLVYLKFFGNMPLDIIGQRLFNGVDSFVFLAMPFFILAGNLMNSTGITRALVRLSQVIVGRIHGGLAQTNIVVSVLFAGLTGSAVADTAAIGSMLVPAMEEEGYSSEYSAAVTASSSIIGPIIPPSIIMVIYGAVTGESIGSLFMAGFVPGVVVALCLMAMAFFFAIKENHPRRTESFTKKEITDTFRSSIIALLVPIIIIGGILSGVFTATEAAAVAVAYSLIVGIFIYKNLTVKTIIKALKESAIVSAAILLIVACSNILSLALAIEHVPQQIATIVTGAISNKYVFLFAINIFLLFMGMVMEIGASVILLSPILLPLAIQYGIHPLHFALIMLVNLNIGLATPPLGVCIFTISPIAKTPIEKIVRKIMPFLAVEVIALFLITYIPDLVLFIPRLTGYL